MNTSIGIGALLFILYWWLLAHLVDVILDSPRLKRTHWILVGLINTIIVFSVYSILNSPLLSFFVMITLMLIEFVFFYKNKFSNSLLCTLACSIHVLSLFMVTVGIISGITGFFPYEILSNGDIFNNCVIISFGILNLTIIGAINLVPLPKVKLLCQHDEQKWFIIAWMAVNNVPLLYTAYSFNSINCPAYIPYIPIVNSITIIISLYIVIFFSIKTSTILGYKEKSKILEQAIQQEQQYRISMVKDAIASYEVNVTKDLIIKGFEDMRDVIGESVYSYSEMLKYMSHRIIHPEDVENFTREYTRENIINLVENGQSEMAVEYRRLVKNGKHIWVRAIINFVEDIETKDIKAFVCIKNIDKEKKNHLELQRLAERDPLTGLYNKSVTCKMIEDNLALSRELTSSALFMIDVDNFKEINNNFGHVYGDAVLCELADKLKNIFRKNDIVGRIGGDEFIVFLKDCEDIQKVEEKATEICKAFNTTYKGLGSEVYTISSSIGISFYPKDGNTFNDLYTHADIALYSVKNSGKNAYAIYDGQDFSAYPTKRTEIQSIGNISQKSFRHNRIEYIFKMLYTSENPFSAIPSALELVASHFSFERGYIFETSLDKKTTNNIFEWCAEGATSEIENRQKIPIEVDIIENINFQRNGSLILKNIEELSQEEIKFFEPLGVKSMYLFGIFDKNQLLGFIGFDNCKIKSAINELEIDEITTICNILATFFVKQHLDKSAEKDLLARQEIMNHLDSYIYVINDETFEVLFMNEKIQKLMNESKSNVACYSFFRGNSEQCHDCPLRQLSVEKKGRIICELYNEKLDIWMEATVSALRWTDGTRASLINCIDITKQKETHISHILELENLAYVDSLTGCRTYYKFKEDAQRILAKHRDSNYFFVKLDIDNFKLINQIYGFERGNEVLRCVANAIEKTTRNEDEIFARVNNDEFVAMFTFQNNAEIDKLNKTFIQNFYELVGDDFAFKCNFPHGRYIVTQSNSKRLDLNDMFEKVNFAHKAAKLDKTVDFVFYDERMTKEALHFKEIENRMTDALENDEFTVYLQPKYFLSNETIGGAEALTRWKNSNVDLFFPSTFIPIFEENGFIVKLDFYIFNKVCNIIKNWIDQGLEPVAISVNFSRLHLSNVNFVKELCEIVDKAGIDRKYLEIEITETVIYDNIDTLEILLNEIHNSGFSMSMDDFGSGYSSLGMLKNLPVDVIKIDKSFFANQKDIQRSKTVVGSVIQMASRLGIKTVAEGVEDQEHIDFLRDLKCDMVQGYYFAKPMKVANFTELLNEEKEGE